MNHERHYTAHSHCQHFQSIFLPSALLHWGRKEQYTMLNLPTNVNPARSAIPIYGRHCNVYSNGKSAVSSPSVSSSLKFVQAGATPSLSAVKPALPECMNPPPLLTSQSVPCCTRLALDFARVRQRNRLCTEDV